MCKRHLSTGIMWLHSSVIHARKYISGYNCTFDVMDEQLSLLACPFSIAKIIFFVCVFFGVPVLCTVVVVIDELLLHCSSTNSLCDSKLCSL